MNKSDLNRNAALLQGPLAKHGYMRWWHSFVGVNPHTKEERTFFVEYFIINPELGGNMPILGQHPYYKKRNRKPSYVMIKAGAFPTMEDAGCQLHAFYPISSLKTTKAPLVMQVEDCLYSETRISGYVDISQSEARHKSLMSDAGYMEWDLEVYKAVACHTGILANRFFTALNALNSFWHGEGIRTFFKGSVHLNGITYEVDPDTCYGYADKHWGRSYNQPWLQLASCRLTSERTGKELKHSAFAIDGCCPKFLCFPMKRKLFLQFTYTGEDFTFHFANPYSRCKWKIKETNKRYIFHIMAQNKDAVLKLSGSSPKAGMMPLKYEAPDGTVPEAPFTGAAGFGTAELYRITPEGPKLIDKLKFENALWEYQSE